jgi:hypothetical protein
LVVTGVLARPKLVFFLKNVKRIFRFQAIAPMNNVKRRGDNRIHCGQSRLIAGPSYGLIINGRKKSYDFSLPFIIFDPLNRSREIPFTEFT